MCVDGETPPHQHEEAEDDDKQQQCTSAENQRRRQVDSSNAKTNGNATVPPPKSAGQNGQFAKSLTPGGQSVAKSSLTYSVVDGNGGKLVRNVMATRPW